MNNAAANTNPFPGLRPFREEEKHLFFGRERQVNAMVNKLAHARFLAVVGASGSGKSSLVNCGLRPALHRGLLTRAGTAWRIAQFRPGSDPLAAMAHALAEDGILYERRDNGLPLEEIIDTHLRVSKRGLLEVYRKAPLPNDVNLLVVVDQFEELFRYRTLTTQKADESHQEAIAFINLLLEVREQTDLPIYVTLTMRSDFLGDCAQFAGLTEAINAGQFLVPRMTRAERRAAIAGPVGVGRIEILHIGEGNGQADVAGPVGEGRAQITPVLLTRLVNDVGDKPDQLSILQHALNRTWARWASEGKQQGPLNLAHYEAIGTMERALDQHAEKAYAELQTERQQKLCARVFKTLTDKGTDVRGIRRPTTLSTLCALSGAHEAEVIDVINVFREPSRSFLMPPLHEPVNAETVVDISHESLMRVWERLKTWADEEADSARIYRRLVETATLYEANKAGLWRDPDLQLALDWREHEEPTTAWAALYGGGFEAAMAFLDESEALRAHEVRLEKKRQRRLRFLLVLLAFLLLIATGAFLVALQQQGIAHDRAVEADSLRSVAEANADSALANAIEADSLRSVAEANADSALANAEEALRLRLLALANADSAQANAEEADRQRILADSSAAEADRQTQNLRLNNSRRLALQANNFLESALQTGPDVALLLSVEAIRNAFTTEAYETQSRALQQNPQLNTFFHGHTGAVNSVVFSPDGRHLITGSSDKTIILWDLEKNEPLDTLSHTHAIWGLTISPDGKPLASASDDGLIRLWDMATGDSLTTLQGHTGDITTLAFSPDGTRLASGSKDDEILLWHLDAAVPPDTLRGHEDDVQSLAFSGPFLASGSADQTIRLWYLAQKDSVITFKGHADEVQSVAFSPDGTKVASSSRDGKVILWNVPPDKEASTETQTSTAFTTLTEYTASVVRSIAFSPDGTTLAAADQDEGITFWDVAESRPLGDLLRAHTDYLFSIAFSPDGKTLASASADETIRFWDVETRQALGEPLQRHETYFWSVAFSPDGKTLASGDSDGTIILWDVATRRPLGNPLEGHQSRIYSLAFSPDGKTLASGSMDRTARLWDVETRQALGEPLPEHPNQVWSVAFSPDGKYLASGSYNEGRGKGNRTGTIHLWDVATRDTIRTFLGHASRVFSVAFSPDNARLASGSDNIILWDIQSGDRLQILGGESGVVQSLAFSPDGTRLASGGSGVTLWDVDLQARACRIANRNLTQEEWRRYIGTENPYRRTCPNLPAGQ